MSKKSSPLRTFIKTLCTCCMKTKDTILMKQKQYQYNAKYRHSYFLSTVWVIIHVNISAIRNTIILSGSTTIRLVYSFQPLTVKYCIIYCLGHNTLQYFSYPYINLIWFYYYSTSIFFPTMNSEILYYLLLGS